ncbi:hypothetical protein [Kitasatospora sp. NPDC048407]|uniref:hypothetical protein n=1 Tax=Kitasatospora sp. NPDC048407 TaxID=3364051 RepID=UPI0037121FF7
MGLSLDALDAVEWAGLETARRSDPVEAVPQTLRHLAQAGAAATEEDCDPLYRLCPRSPRQLPSAAPVAAPFLLALATDPDMGARRALTELLALLLPLSPELMEQHRASVLLLLADPDPAVRQVAAPLAVAAGLLSERWQAETDRTARIALLLALRKCDSVEAPAVLAKALADDDPALYVAAVHTSAATDPDLPVRHFERLIAVLTDPAPNPRFDGVWYILGIDEPLERENVIWWVSRLFAHRPDLENAYLLRLLAVAERTADALLCQETLDIAWVLLTRRRSVDPELTSTVGQLLTHPSPDVRQRAANFLGGLGPVAAPYADQLAALLDDDATDPEMDGTVGELARWALLRIGDRRGLPGLAEQLRAHAEGEDECRGCGAVDGPHPPSIVHALAPLRADADTLLPEVREALRRESPHGAACDFLAVLESWGRDAAAALPDVLPLLDEPFTAPDALAALSAFGPDAAAIIRGLGLTAARLQYRPDLIAEDRPTALRLIGEAVLSAEHPWQAPIARLGEFGPAAAPYADHLRHVMATTEHKTRIAAASALCSVTGRPGPSLDALAEFIVPIAEAEPNYFLFATAMRAAIQMGTISPAIRTALLAARRSEGRLSDRDGYEAILDDEHHRALIDQALACPDAT